VYFVVLFLFVRDRWWAKPTLQIGQEVEFYFGEASLTLAPPFSHGIVALNGWPLNALRRDDHSKKPIGKKSA
jgi:hypothetical protein